MDRAWIRWLRRLGNSRAAADEITHIHESASEVRRSRRRLSIPLVVVTGDLGADAEWRGLQRDQVSVSERGCQIIARESGHAVAIYQPAIVVDAIRRVVEAARGRNDVPLCGIAAFSKQNTA